MKRIIIAIIATSFCHVAFAQVGVNTENPQQLLHIKGTSSDVVVGTSTGNLGVGTINPSQKLDVAGNVNVSDGVKIDQNATPANIGVGTITPAAGTLLHLKTDTTENVIRLNDTSAKETGFLMTTDASGYAYWDALRPLSSVVGKRSNCITAGLGVKDDNYKEGNVQVTTTANNLVLPPGKWLIFARVETTSATLDGFYLYLILCTGTGAGRTGINRVGDLGGKPHFIYYVNISTQTTYSLAIATSGVTATTTGVGYFYALRIDRNN